MIQKLKSIIQSANPDYLVEFEESSMMNVKVDNYPDGAKFTYIEEYRQGRYFKESYVNKKATIFQIYFCKFTEFQNDADEREKLRNEIESEIVLPFMESYNKSGLFEKAEIFQFYTPLSRFDANEVSIMLQFEVKETKC